MANWRKLSVALVLADGVIDADEVKILRKELFADGVIDKDEREFLIELRNAAQKKAKARKVEVNPQFEKLFFDAIEKHVLEDGVIDANEARWLREMLFADKIIDANEKKFLSRLKQGARKTSPAFDKLYEECMAR
jgi:hypothetical protein